MKLMFRLMLFPFYLIVYMFKALLWTIAIIPLAIMEGLAGKK